MRNFTTFVELGKRSRHYRSTFYSFEICSKCKSEKLWNICCLATQVIFLGCNPQQTVRNFFQFLCFTISLLIYKHFYPDFSTPGVFWGVDFKKVVRKFFPQVFGFQNQFFYSNFHISMSNFTKIKKWFASLLNFPPPEDLGSMKGCIKISFSSRLWYKKQKSWIKSNFT